MSLILLRPAALASAIAIAAIIALHVIQSRRRRRVVPSLIVWRRVLARGVAVKARRASLDLPLALAVAGGGLLVFAAAAPEIVAVTAGADEVVIVIDNGTSSLSEFRDASRRASGPTRFAESVERARAGLARTSPRGRAALVATSPEPRVVVGMSDASQVARSLATLAPVQVTGSLVSAVGLALAQGRGAARVVVYTSRLLDLGKAPPRVTLEPLGAPSRNLAIVRADFSGEEVFCATRNYAAREAAARLSLRTGAREIAGREVTVAAGGRRDVLFSPEGDALEAYRGARAVSLSIQHAEDDLAADNTVWATWGFERARRVGLVGRPSEPLGRALRAARVEAVALAAADRAERVDLLVYSATVPEEWPPKRPAALIAPERSVGPVRILGDELRDVRGRLVAGRTAPALVRGLPPVALQVHLARKARILAPHEPLIVTEGEGELLAAVVHGRAGDHVYLGFRPENSDWPARASFPVFVQRLLQSVTSGEVKRGELTFALVGDSGGAHLPPEGTTVVRLGAAEQPREARLLAAGLYRVRRGEGEEGLLAVNLLSETESDNRLADRYEASPEERGTRAAAAEAEAEEALLARRVTARDLAGVLAALGLFLLAAEWIVSARRT